MALLAGDAIASEALAGLLKVLGRSRGALFELTIPGDRGFHLTAALGAPPREWPKFAQDSLLPRWLRVNRQALAIPDQIGICETLSVSEQAALRDAAPAVAVPLLAESHLVAWAVLSDSPGSGPSIQRVPAVVQSVADRLRSARSAALESSKNEAIARANKLSLTGQLAAGIAHEVRNPLAAVRSIVQAVRSGAVPASEHGRLLDNVVAEVDRVSRVVTNLLVLGRATPSRTESIELEALIADAADFCRAYAHHRGQTIHVAPANREWVRGNVQELRQVLVNLLLNACQASRQGQTVIVRKTSGTNVSGDRVAALQVEDHGHGILPDVMARVFDPFFTTKADGGGLGLCLCRDVLRQHGGSIAIASEPGTGTVVTLELPV